MDKITLEKPLSSPLKVAHVSDTHLLENAEGMSFGVNPFQRLANVLNMIKSGRYDLLVISGDIADNGHINSYQLLHELLTQVDLPTILIPGNHDDEQNLANTISSTKNLWVSPKEPIQLGDWNFVHMNNNIPGKPQGKVTIAALKKLENQLHTLSSPICLLLHHPAFATRIPKIDQYGLVNPEILLATLPEKVRLVLSGHVHGDYRWFHEGTFFESAPSSAFQFDPPIGENNSIYKIQKQGYSVNVGIYGFKEYLLSPDHYHSRTIWCTYEKMV